MSRARVTIIVALLVGSTLAGTAADASPAAIRVVRNIIYGPSFADAFRRPRAITSDLVNQFFIVGDTGNHRLVLFDGKGRCRGAIESDPGGDGRVFAETKALDLGDRGRLFAVDALDPRIEVLTTTGSHVAYIDPPFRGALADELRPQAVAIGAGDRLYCLYGGPRAGLVMMEPNGTVVQRLGFEPPDRATFVGPVSLAVNADETRIAIVDPEAERAVKLYDGDGQLIAAFGEHGDGEGTFSMAVHATWGPHDTLWVTDTLRHSISVFDRWGTYLDRVGGFGPGPGQFNHPAGCAFVAADRIVVLERGASRCQVIEVEVEEPPERAPSLASAVRGPADGRSETR